MVSVSDVYIRVASDMVSSIVSDNFFLKLTKTYFFFQKFISGLATNLSVSLTIVLLLNSFSKPVSKTFYP